MACNTNSGSAVYVLNDGRAFTDYRPNCELNEYLKAKYAPGASSEYRMFLQHNACALMKEQREMNGFVNPSGSYCNYSHPPHSAGEAARYSWQPSAGYLNNRYKGFNAPILAPGGNWTNLC